MGMYTEIVVKINFKKSQIQREEYDVLEYLFNPNSPFDWDNLPDTPDHEFFLCDRWPSIGHCSSFYHHPNDVNDWYAPTGITDSIYVFSRSDLKNYDNEIMKFFDWLNTINLGNSEDEFIGYSLYEEDNEPTIYKYKEIRNDKE